MSKQISSKKKDFPKEEILFSKQNYILLFVAVALMIVGYLLMVGGGSDDPNVFDVNELYGFRRITLAPLLVLSGFVVGVYAIMKKPKEE